MSYHHLTQEERDQLAVLRSQGLKLRDMAHRLGRSVSSLSRELRRNQGEYGYFPHSAQRKADQRLEHSHRRLRLKSPALRLEVQRRLEYGWSPEIIAGRLRRIRPDLPSITTEAIYQWIYRERKDLIRFLVRRHPHRWHPQYRHRQRIPGRVSVRERPLEVQDRTEAGHWETDLVVGPSRGALQVLVERQTRYSRLRLVPHRTSGACRVALTVILSSIPASLRRSITYDNGGENAEHQTLNDDFDMRSYFCEPYHSWEKGTVENTNGLIRRYFPKGIPLEAYLEPRVERLEHWLNDRPRKVLQFKTPREAFEALCCT
jgi:IS30 family transposase